MQTNNQNGKHRTTHHLYLSKALLFKGSKVREGKGKQNITILLG